MDNEKRIVVALGGNALSEDGKASAADQLYVAMQTAKKLSKLIKSGHQLAIVHGNGPQIGNIILHEEAINTPQVPTMPIDVCGAMSQGQIGYWLQNALKNTLMADGSRNQTVASVVTQVVVDPADPAFSNPSKPIGPFYQVEAEAKAIAAERGFMVKEDAGRGWRRVIASPKPINIVEADFIKNSLESGAVVISTGGGGIPVKIENNQIVGVEAVIDKDFAAAKLAELIDADVLIILTAVDAVKINYGKPNEQAINRMSVKQARDFIAQGQFAEGSMLPKIEAAIRFVESSKERFTLITSPDKLEEALAGQTGSIITI